MSALDTLFSIFKGANPDASDEDIRAHLDSMKASPDQMQGALAPFTPPTDGKFTPDVPPQEMPTPDLSLKFPTPDSTPSGFDIGVSDNTATQNGSAPSVTSDPSSVPPPPPPPTPATEGIPPLTAPQENKVPPTAPTASAPSGSVPKNASDPLKSLVEGAPKPDAEDAMLAKEKQKHNLGILPVALGGIGDALGNAAKAVGGSAKTDSQEKIAEGINTSIDKDKAAFEAKERKDPTSDVSRHYQKVLSLMLGEHAKSMDVSKMSAEHIAATLPEVEKYMQKELGLKQIQSNKDLQMAMHEQGRQDKLEKDTREWVDNLSKARNGELGVQNGKVDQARHLLQLYKQSEETGKPLSNSQYGELAMGTAALVAGGAQNVSDQTKHMIMQSTAKGDVNKALTWAGADPSILGGSTDSVLKNLKDTIIRQGSEAEHQRDKFINDQKAIAPSGLNKTQSDRILNQQYGNSIKEFLPQNQHPNAGAVPTVIDQQTYDRLPSGASYQDASGKIYRKK